MCRIALCRGMSGAVKRKKGKREGSWLLHIEAVGAGAQHGSRVAEIRKGGNCTWHGLAVALFR